MSAEDKDLWRLNHILEAIQKIKEFLNDTESFEKFFDDAKTQASVKYEMLVIGEASSHLTERVKGIASGTEWRSIRAVRNYLAHEYFAVDVNAIWEMTQLDLPKLEGAINQITKKLKEEK